jgi:hypothetical protein
MASEVARSLDAYSMWPGLRVPKGATLLLCTAGLVLPNLMFGIADLLAGVPPRPAAIATYALLALAAPFLPPAMTAVLYVALVAADLLMTICTAFFLSPADLVGVLGAAASFKVVECPLYASLIVVGGALTVANAAIFVGFRSALARGNRTALAACTLVLVAGDLYINSSVHYEFGPLASFGQPFESAVESSGFGDLATRPAKSGHNVLLVLVESLGVLRAPAQREILFRPFRDPELLTHYSVSTGRTTFFGATSYGEMRELCHTRDSYSKILAGEASVCLPDLFAENGYRTVSVHGFTHAFYDRASWYPKVGFERSLFPETFKRTYARHCGGPFVGPCDVDLAEGVGDRLRATGQPNFVYWLTLNTHVPVRAGQARPRYGCENGGGPFGDAEVCTMAELWADLFEAVTKLAVAHPETEILLVGDHAPPLWRRAARDCFEPGHVPWIRLTPVSGARVAEHGPVPVDVRGDRASRSNREKRAAVAD